MGIKMFSIPKNVIALRQIKGNSIQLKKVNCVYYFIEDTCIKLLSKPNYSLK